MRLRNEKIIASLLLVALLVGCGRQGETNQNYVTTKESVKEPNTESTEETKSKQTKVEAQESIQESKSTKVEAQESIQDSKSTKVEAQESIQDSKSTKVEVQENVQEVENSQTEVANQKPQQIKTTKEPKVEIQKGVKDSKVVKEQKVEDKVLSSESQQQQIVTLSINCGTILDHKESLNPDKVELVPSDGVILSAQELTYKEGETVFDVLVKATKNHKIHMEYTGSNIYKTNYIEGINNLYEFDCGPLSGWMYKVNGVFPNYGCSNYVLKEGDIIEWVYTCDLGKDVGAEDVLQEDETK